MGDISIIEFGVYGFIAYTSILMLIISTVRTTNATEFQFIPRAIYFVPGIVCAIILATSGVNITLETVATSNITNATITNSTIFIEEAVTTSAFVLLDPIWGTVHFMIAVILIVYVLTQVLMLLGYWPQERK